MPVNVIKIKLSYDHEARRIMRRYAQTQDLLKNHRHNATRLVKILLITSLALLAACNDNYENEFEQFSTASLVPNRKYSASSAFGNIGWQFICAGLPGRPPKDVINTHLPDFSADWLNDEKLQKGDFPPGYSKILLLSKDRFKVYILHQMTAVFKVERCLPFDDAAILVEQPAPSPRRLPVFLELLDESQ